MVCMETEGRAKKSKRDGYKWLGGGGLGIRWLGRPLRRPKIPTVSLPPKKESPAELSPVHRGKATSGWNMMKIAYRGKTLPLSGS